jgi:alanine racemase
VIQPHGRAVIDLAALRHNVATLKARANGPALMAVVKADAYGHGLVPCAKAAVEGGANWLATALLDEAIALREAGIKVPVLCWLNTYSDRFAECINLDIDLGVNGSTSLEAIARAAREVGKVARVHIKVDTGLGRNGVWHAQLPELIQELQAAADAVQVVGVMSHFAYADEPSNPTIHSQIAIFKSAVDQLLAAGFDLEVKHLSNSAATLGLPETYFNLIRPGVAIYGISPGGEVATAAQAGLRPVMTLRGAVALVKEVPAETGVSYAHQYHTSAQTKLALIPLGYADGIPRSATNVGPVLVGGQRRTISGRVCMDQFVVDIGDLPVAAGDEVILFGDPAKGEPSIEDWAEAVGTIPYEIATRLGPRVPREYVN